MRNDDTKAMPNVTIDLDDYEPWVIASVDVRAKDLGDGVYSFGRLEPGAELDATLTLVPNESGNFTISTFVYGDVTDNSAQGLHSFGNGDPIGGLQQDVAILP